jgi:ABC-type nickel/cobalt efflux system permease component RcnA
MTLAKAKLASSITFIVLASFTIITYDRQNMFIIQATDGGREREGERDREQHLALFKSQKQVNSRTHTHTHTHKHKHKHAHTHTRLPYIVKKPGASYQSAFF